MSRRDTLRRIFTLTGVVPVGIFLVLHVWTKASALGGSVAFNAWEDRLWGLPLISAIEVLGILLPLAFHAGYGVYLSFERGQSTDRYPFGKSWVRPFGRATGMVTLVFILAHLWEFRVQKWLYGMHAHSFFGAATADLSSMKWGVPWIALGYLGGLSAAVAHFTVGLATFAMSSGRLASKSARRVAAGLIVTVGVGLMGFGVLTVVYFSTGASLFPVKEAPNSLSAGSCP